MRAEHKIIAFFIVTGLVIHLTGDIYAGYHGDELLHIEAGNHPAAGYMDFSPMIAYMAFIQNQFHSPSIFINHLFLHLATALIFLLCGLITMEYGGKALAVTITMSCILFSPGLGASHSLFLPDVFDQLAWVLCIFFLVKFSVNDDWRFLPLIAISAAAGFLTKYTILFFAAGLVPAVLLFKREILSKRILWISAGIFLVLILPNVLWQIQNNFPAFRHLSELYESQLDKQSRFQELKSMFLYLNPLTSIFWAGGLFIVHFRSSFKKYRLVTFTLLFSFVLFFLARAKSYYYFPVILGVLPAGAMLAEEIFSKKNKTLIAYLSLTCVLGTYLLPRGIPLMPLDRYISFYDLTENDDGRIPLPFENYYSAPIWDSIISVVSTKYESFTPEEKKRCLVWGRHYSQAGAINLLGPQHGLPRAFSFHSSFYSWVPDFERDITIIAISDANLKEEFWHQFFDEVTEISTVGNRYTSDYKWFTQHVYLCRKLRYDSSELKEKFRDEVF